MIENEGLAIFGIFVFVFTILMFIFVSIFACTCKRKVIEDTPQENDYNQGFLNVGDKSNGSEQ